MHGKICTKKGISNNDAAQQACLPFWGVPVDNGQQTKGVTDDASLGVTDKMVQRLAKACRMPVAPSAALVAPASN